MRSLNEDGAAPSMSMLEHSLDAVKAFANEEVVAQMVFNSFSLVDQLRHSRRLKRASGEQSPSTKPQWKIVAKDGANFIVTHGGAPSMSHLWVMSSSAGPYFYAQRCRAARVCRSPRSILAFILVPAIPPAPDWIFHLSEKPLMKFHTNLLCGLGA